MSAKEKWVHRFAVDDTAKHKNGFTIYKITSYLYPITSPESISVVSVWKRYSDVEKLHKSMRSLHTGLHLKGTFPTLVKRSFFKRFDPEVIDERVKNIKTLLEFVAEHQLLCTSTDFVKFLENGYPSPVDRQSSSVINSIRTSLHLPIEDTSPLEYQSSEDEGESPRHDTSRKSQEPKTMDDSNLDPDFPGVNIDEIKTQNTQNISLLNLADSIESLNSLESLDSDTYDELSKISIDKHKPFIKKTVLPDLINFDEPSTSKFDDYHTMVHTKIGNTDSDSISLNSISMHSEPKMSISRISLSSRRSLNMSDLGRKVRTDDDYVFEAAQLLNLAVQKESMKEYRQAFEFYNCAIEKMLIGVKSDTDPERRALLKSKTSVYLSHAEMLHKNHLCDNEDNTILSNLRLHDSSAYSQLPIQMFRGEYNDLSYYKVIAIVGETLMVVLHSKEHKCYVMKVIKKVPLNLTDFDSNIPLYLTTRRPILPTNVPYMVNLNSFVETENLIFLILDYAPGEKLIDYINKYVQSLPNTPARELNLENVFVNPIMENSDYSTNDEVDNAIRINIDERISNTDEKISQIDEKGKNIDETNKTESKEIDVSVNELVRNSQRLLSNIDKTLNAVRQKDEIVDRIQIEVVDKNSNSDVTNKSGDKLAVDKSRNDESPLHLRSTPRSRSLIPPMTICKWGAEILVALDSLHECGVICRDLNQNNVLLGNNGQVLLTYFIGYHSMEMALSLIQRRTVLGHSNLYIAPELYNIMSIDNMDERVSDYWSYGAILYELLCGVPLSHYHKSVFNSHTILIVPEHLDVEAKSILTQLLTFDPAERLGAGKQGVTEIKQHPYFKNIDWDACMRDGRTTFDQSVSHFDT